MIDGIDNYDGNVSKSNSSHKINDTINKSKEKSKEKSNQVFDGKKKCNGSEYISEQVQIGTNFVKDCSNDLIKYGEKDNKNIDSNNEQFLLSDKEQSCHDKDSGNFNTEYDGNVSKSKINDTIKNVKNLIYNKLLISKYGYRIIQTYFNELLPFWVDLKVRFYYYFCNRKVKIQEQHKISQFIFEPTNICNTKCTFCIYKKIKNPKYIMSFDLYKKGLDEFVRMGGKVIYLTPTVGEAFVDKGLFDKIIYAKNKGLIVKLHTNGTLLNINDNYKKIVNSNIDELLISIGDMDIEFESQIYGIKERISKQKIEGTVNLIEYNKEKLGIKKIILNFRSARTPYEIFENLELKKILSNTYKFELVYDFLFGYDNWGGNISEEDLIGIMKIKRTIKFRKYPCLRLYNTLIILSNGDLRACGCVISDKGSDELIIGNINSTSIQELTNGDKLKQIRNGFEHNILPNVCKKCSYYEPYILYKI